MPKISYCVSLIFLMCSSLLCHDPGHNKNLPENEHGNTKALDSSEVQTLSHMLYVVNT